MELESWLLIFLLGKCIYFLFVGMLGSELQTIINDGSSEVDSGSSDFWVMVAALKVTLCNSITFSILKL